MDPALQAAGLGLLGAIALAVPAWLASMARQDASLADRFWPAFIAVPALLAAWRLGADARAMAMLALIVAWGVRLGVFITVRNWGHGEDRRYRAMRDRDPVGFPRRSFFTVFVLQATLGWIVGLPVLAACNHPGPWTAWDTLGAVVAAGGIVTEALADAQLAAFRRDPASRGRVMDRGLWGWSRHPNYFGECCVWWGLAVMALAADGGWSHAWVLVSPLLMTVLLLRVSGVTLLEQDIGERRPGYREYVERTSAFIPWPPRRNAP